MYERDRTLSVDGTTIWPNQCLQFLKPRLQPNLHHWLVTICRGDENSPALSDVFEKQAIDPKVVLQDLWLDANLGAIMGDDQTWSRNANDVVHAHRSEGDKPEHDGCDLAERGTPGLWFLFEIVAHCYRQPIDWGGAAAFGLT